MRPLSWAIVTTMLAAAPSVTAADRRIDVPREFASLLQCKREPHAAALTVELARLGYIHASPDHGVDSLSCFRLRKPLSIPARGGGPALRPSWVCVYDEKPDERHPKLFWRGPGTSPGNTLAAYTTADLATVRAWSRANGGGRAVEISPGPHSLHRPEIDRLAGVTCNGDAVMHNP